MEEKSKASEMLSQMKRYIHSDAPSQSVQPTVEESVPEVEADLVPDNDAAIQINEEAPVSAENESQELEIEFVEPEPVVIETPKPAKPKVRKLPDDDALFEFDEIAFDDVMIPEPPVLTPEEAELADELREKFGVSSSVGIAFINEEPTDDGNVSYAPEKNEEPESEAQAAEQTEEAFDNQNESVEAEEDLAEIQQISEDFAEAEQEPEVQVKAMQTDNPDDLEQVVFGGLENLAVEEKPEPAPARNEFTSSGVQLTFLDSDEEDDFDMDPEQIAFDEPASEQIDDSFDSAEVAEESDGQSEEVEKVEQESGEVYQPASVSEPIIYEAAGYDEEPIGDEDYIEDALYEPELTALEKNAIEEEAARAEAEAESSVEAEVEQVTEESYEGDVWDERDRELYVAKKKYLDFCDTLPTPPMRVSKGGTYAPTSAKMATSGYRYEMTERLPLFTDGRNGGKNTEGYKAREIEYCESRESKRSVQLIDKMRTSSKKLMFSFVIMLAIIITENIGVFFAGKPDLLLTTTSPAIFGIIEAILLCCGGILVLDSIRDGIKCALKGMFILEALTVATVIPTVIYHVVIVFIGSNSEHTMLFGTGAAISIFLTALYRYNAIKREHTVFTVTASYGEYLTEAKMSGYKQTPDGKAFGEYTDEDTSLYKINKVSRIDGSYADMTVRDECGGLIAKLLIAIVAFAVVCGVVFGIIRHDAVYGAISAISLITFAAPVSTFVALSFARLKAATVSAENGGAIVDFDDESDEFDSSVFMIDDGELFPPEKLMSSNFEIYSASVEAHLARTLALFKKIGGPVSIVFRNVEGTVDNFQSIHITEITEHGIQAKIDGRPICAGTESFMKHMGIKIKKYDKNLRKNGRVMYIADDGEFFARLILIFNPDEKLVRKISEFRNTETVFTLKTCNPCIDKELLFYTTGLEPELIRLVKYKAGDDVAPAETDREGSIVSSGGANGLLTALLEYKRQKKHVANSFVLSCIAAGVGAGISLMLSAIGYANVGVSSLIALGLHGTLSLIGFLLSKRSTIDTKTKIKKK